MNKEIPNRASQEDYNKFQNNSMLAVDHCLKQNGLKFTQELINKSFRESLNPHIFRLRTDEAFLLYLSQRDLYV